MNKKETISRNIKKRIKLRFKRKYKQNKSMEKNKPTIKTKKIFWTYKNCGPITMHNLKIWTEASRKYGIETRTFLGIPMLISRNRRMFDFGHHETRMQFFKIFRYQMIFGDPEKLKSKLLLNADMAFIYYEMLKLGNNKSKKWPGQEIAANEVCNSITKWQKENQDKIEQERKNQQKNKHKQ